MGHWPVVSHHDQQGVFRDAEFFEFVHHLADEGIDVPLQAILQEASCLGDFFDRRHERGHHGPIGHVKGLARFGLAFDEFQRSLLGFRIELHVVIVGVVAPLTDLSALFALGDLDPCFGDERVVHLVGVFGGNGGEQPDGGVGLFRLGIPQGENLVVASEERFVKALVGGIAFFDIAEVPLAMEGCRVASFGEDFRECDFVFREAMAFQKHADVVHAIANGMSPGHDRRPAGRAADFGVHSGKKDPLFRHLVHVRRFEASDFLDRGDAHVAKGGVVPHDVDQVRGLAAIFLAKRCQLRVDVLVLDSPFLSILSFNDVILRVVHDLLCRLRQGGSEGSRQETKRNHQCFRHIHFLSRKNGPAWFGFVFARASRGVIETNPTIVIQSPFIVDTGNSESKFKLARSFLV